MDRSGALLAPFTYPATGTPALEEGEAGLLSARPSIPAGLGRAAFIAVMLTLGPAVTGQAGAPRAPRGERTVPSVVAGQLPTGHASFTIEPSITLRIDVMHALRDK